MHFFKLLSLPSAQQVVKADAAETWFVLFDIGLAKKLAVILLLMFKSTPLYCDSANSQSNPVWNPGSSLFCPAGGGFPLEKPMNKSSFISVGGEEETLHYLPTSSCKMLALFCTDHFRSRMKMEVSSSEAGV